MKNLRRALLDLAVDCANVIRLDRKFRTVQRRQRCVLHQVDLGSVSSKNGNRIILVEKRKTQASNEEVQTDVDVGIKNLRNQAKQHVEGPFLPCHAKVRARLNGAGRMTQANAWEEIEPPAGRLDESIDQFC